MANISVSVVMPSFNVADYIYECIKSVIDQDMKNIEIICIDAGSTDGTREILFECAKNDKRIRIINSPIKSYGYQVNCGIREAVGKYISIVETDDYTHPSMLSYLYGQAEKFGADVYKADNKGFWVDECGEKVFYDNHLFDDEEHKLYHMCLSNDTLPNYIHLYDSYLWGAIYKREFLLKNNIVMNESLGAAYQDIGFIQQVHLLAKRVVYSDAMLYYYRTDRMESSSNQSSWLRNIYQEYEFLFHMSELSRKLEWKLYRNYVANRISYVFITELERSLVNTRFDITNTSWIDYYKKIRLVIRRFIEKNMISERVFPKEWWGALLLSIHSLESYRDYVKVKYNDKERKKKYLLQQCCDKLCMIFGGGARGKRAYVFLKDNGIKVHTFLDNDKNKWGDNYQGVPIKQPASISINDNVLIIIAIRDSEDTIVKQLKKLGWREESIVAFW
ncbi:Glycosyltransferase involved in cell wall bisynthesis [Selenomonas ruminantium]|uniref:Glycosyltransferase involved in cell wall bisynthesis n=1 Tax=Selenomonas ruminantium TaxID=971 RepID=A0A1M6UKN0_SELRU|nr:glycosyltransferase family 2 protein [Selenomonas ruminantium]SHK69737.1 Glycosyltransferase involved in cell wall bisynthesis [Selenomonas ruminantium]